MLNHLPAVVAFVAAATHADCARRKSFVTGHMHTGFGNAVKLAPR